MNKGPEFNRRVFLGRGVKGALGLAAIGGGLAVSSPRNVLGANDRVRVAVCGVRGRGFDHVRFASLAPNAEVAAVCEVDENIWRKRQAEMERWKGGSKTARKEDGQGLRLDT